MNTIVVDIDNTITIHSNCDYDEMPVFTVSIIEYSFALLSLELSL